MSGHSKWSTIKRKKEKTDSQRAKIFTKIGRELTVAVRQGGSSDPSSNFKLRDCILKAKNNNVPNENIERIIKKAILNPNESNYRSINYEGYGPGGVAIIVETLTDNRNRTAADLRHYFDKYGGSMGTPGCVSFIFEKKGLLVLKKENINVNSFFEDCIEVGASDFNEEVDFLEIFSKAADFLKIKKELENKKYSFDYAEIETIPNTYISLTGKNLDNMQKLLDRLNDNDDVQNVWHNLET
ncbi:MAG: YebC/PmpR family DNA-binding transcriptional regulator [Oscillospiraceae bacterium]|nr:YebC/PmpR family DNA-binding transcriptional regulator [Oscillospiraceae bacterium]